MNTPVNIAVLISGHGSNLQALIDDVANDVDHPGAITLVLSNKPDAYGLQRAKDAGIATQIISHTSYTSRQAYDAALHDALSAANIDFVCLAGFMRLLTSDFTTKWHRKMINIHPSLLPDYKGLNTHQRVLEAGEHQTGCTVHYVVADMDAGPIIDSETVDIIAGDTADSLQQRVHAAEHCLYPRALRTALHAL